MALVLLAPQGSSGAPPASIVRERQAYRFDLKRLFYATPAAREADDDRAGKLWASELELKGKVGASAENLLRALTLDDARAAIEDRMALADTAAGLIDVRDEGSADAKERAGEDDEVPEDFLEDELAALDPKTFDAYVAAEPRLAPYRFRIKTARHEKAHRLSAREEGILARLAPFAASWPGEVFESLRGAGPGAAAKETLGIALRGMAGYQTSEARLRGYPDAITETLDSLFLKRSQVDAILTALAGRMKAETEANRTIWTQPVAIQAPGPYGLAQGMAVVRNALAPLGPEYARELAALFDPHNGRMDAAGGPHRNGLAQSTGSMSTPSLLYWPAYVGSYDDLQGIAHEGGHAVHYALMRANGVRPGYERVPGYLFESFAEFNALLLADYLVRRETAPRRKLFFLLRLIGQASQPESIAFYPALEFAIYDGVAKGEITRTAQLDALEAKALARYDPGVPPSPSSPYWSSNEAYYTHPLYGVNHVLGAVLADAYYERYLKNPKEFVPRFLALLRNGFDAPPNELLRRFLGFDLDDPRLVAEGGAIVESRLPELRALIRADTLKSGGQRASKARP